MPSENMRVVIEACRDHAPVLAIAQRAKLYRGLAEFCADEHEAARWEAMAQDLEAADQRCMELALQLTKWPENTSGDGTPKPKHDGAGNPSHDGGHS